MGVSRESGLGVGELEITLRREAWMESFLRVGFWSEGG